MTMNSKDSIPNEIRIILAIAGNKTIELPANEEEINWEIVTETAIENSIAPVLYKNLKNNPKNNFIPRKCFSKLENAYYYSFQYNTKLYTSLSEVLKSFTNAGINAIILKGAALAETVYMDIGLRLMSDIDILISNSDIDRALNLMDVLSYKKINQIHESGYINEFSEAGHHHLPQLVKNNVCVELHTHIVRQNGNYSINIVDFWQTAKTVMLAGEKVLVFSPEYQLLHLCLHLSNHFKYGTIRLIWFYDIARLVSLHSEQINWEYFNKICKRYAVTGIVFHVLQLTDKYIGIDVPVNIRELIYSESHGIQDEFLFQLMKKPEDELSNESLYFLKNIRRGLTVRNSVFNKIKYIASYFFPSGEYMIQRYSVKKPVWVWIYYPYRFVRVIYRVFLLLFRKKKI